MGALYYDRFRYGLWQDATKEYALDRYGNEVTPEQVLLDEYVQDYVRNSKSMDKEAIHYALSAGSVTVTVKNLDQAFYLRRVRIARISTIPYYKDYICPLREACPRQPKLLRYKRRIMR